MKRTLTILLLSLTVLTVPAACQKLNLLEKRVEAIETAINDLISANDRLTQMLSEGKLLKDYYALPEDKGWHFVFSDNSEIDILNGESAPVPVMIVDANGYWCVSYDGGNTVTRLQDPLGRPILAEATSVRIVIDSEGNYVLEVFRVNNPDVVIDKVVTPMTVNKSTLIQYIIENRENRSVMLMMQDGTSFLFGRRETLPTGIVLLSDRLEFGPATTASIEFRINPSDALFNYDLSSPDCQIAIDRTGINTKATGYITPPTNYKLIGVEQVYGEGGRLLEGQYRAYVKDSGTSETYDEYASLVLSLSDAEGKAFQVSSQSVRAFFSRTLMLDFTFRMAENATVRQDIATQIAGRTISVRSPFISDATALVPTFTTSGGSVTVDGVPQTSGVTAQDFSHGPVDYVVSYANGQSSVYRVNIEYSGLPVVRIETPGLNTVTSKDTWMEGATVTIWNTDGSVDYQSDALQIKGRGNSTWYGAPKKPYALKLEGKASILGMPKHKRWVLLANWFDPTLLRNHIAFQASRLTSLPYTVRGQFVELILNNEHLGNYYLCEQIKIDENRVNITKLKKTDISGDAVTGGYLVQMDGHFDEVNKFRSAIMNLPYEFKEPDEEDLQPEQFTYFENFINEMESKMYADDWLETGDYRNYIDHQSWIDRWLVHEITGNPEDWDPRSVYVYKDRGGKLMAGPVWDYDYATFRKYWAETFLSANRIYYGRMLQDPVFVAKVKERWDVIKPLFATLPDFIRAEAEKVRISNGIDNELWPRPVDASGMEIVDAGLTFDEQIDLLVYFVNTKLAWMDTQINNM